MTISPRKSDMQEASGRTLSGGMKMRQLTCIGASSPPIPSCCIFFDHRTTSRLLLEYARIMSLDREAMSFKMPSARGA